MVHAYWKLVLRQARLDGPRLLRVASGAFLQDQPVALCGQTLAVAVDELLLRI